MDELPRVRRRDPAGLLVDRSKLLEVPCFASVHLVEGALDHLRDAEERQPSIQEGRHGDLVCGVEDARHRPSCLSSRAGERKAWERLLVGGRELEVEVRGEREGGDRSSGPGGGGEGKRAWH